VGYDFASRCFGPWPVATVATRLSSGPTPVF
jgi:hypothetical protein